MCEIQTTIKNGLPVLARGSIVGREPSIGCYGYGVESGDFMAGGHPCRIEIRAPRKSARSRELGRETTTDEWSELLPHFSCGFSTSCDSGSLDAHATSKLAEVQERIHH